MITLTPEEFEVVAKVLQSTVVQNLIGGEEWDLTEEDEGVLWDVIRKIEGK